jgi:hypothetical protein
VLKKDFNKIKSLLNDFDSVMNTVSKTTNENVIQTCVEFMNEEQLASSFIQYENIRIWAEKRIEELYEDNTSFKNTASHAHKDPKRPDEIQKKIISCMANITAINNNKAASNWAESIIKVCVPGYKIISNKEMTSKEFQYQCAKRYEHINYRVDEWMNKHPNVRTVSRWSDWGNISFDKSYEPIEIDEAKDMLIVLESSLKNKRIRNSIEKDPSMINVAEKAAQMISYHLHTSANMSKDSMFELGWSRIAGEELVTGEFQNIYKYLILPDVEKYGYAHNIKLNERAQVYSFIK